MKNLKVKINCVAIDTCAVLSEALSHIGLHAPRGSWAGVVRALGGHVRPYLEGETPDLKTAAEAVAVPEEGEPHPQVKIWRHHRHAVMFTTPGGVAVELTCRKNELTMELTCSRNSFLLATQVVTALLQRLPAAGLVPLLLQVAGEWEEELSRLNLEEELRALKEKAEALTNSQNPKIAHLGDLLQASVALAKEIDDQGSFGQLPK